MIKAKKKLKRISLNRSWKKSMVHKSLDKLFGKSVFIPSQGWPKKMAYE